MATWMHSLQLEPPLETLSPDLGNSVEECVTLIYMIMLISYWQLYLTMCSGMYIFLDNLKLRPFINTKPEKDRLETLSVIEGGAIMALLRQIGF